MPPFHAVPEPFHDLVDLSVNEATFLWGRWERELTSPTRNLDDVWSWTEDRLHGALDGVRVAGRGVVDILTTGLISDESNRIALSTGVLASSADEASTDAVAAALSAAGDEKLSSMVRGLEVLGSPQGLKAAGSVLAARGPAYAGALCRLAAFRRVAPGDAIAAAFKSNLSEVQADAIRAALYAPAADAEEWIAEALRSRDAGVRSTAVQSGVYRGMPPAWETAMRLAQQLDADAAPLLKMIAMLGTPEEHEIVYAALRVPELQLQAIWALGHIGTVRAAEACLTGMQYEKLARACGEAYCWMTGADLVRDHLAKDDTPPEVPAFEDDDLSSNLVPPPEALWPLPDVEAVRRDWLARRADFAAAVRHVHGRPATVEALLTMIETGPMLRRPDLILELRAKTRGRYDVEPRAFTSRQRQMMAIGRAALSSHARA